VVSTAASVGSATNRLRPTALYALLDSSAVHWAGSAGHMCSTDSISCLPGESRAHLAVQGCVMEALINERSTAGRGSQPQPKLLALGRLLPDKSNK
jgi:hypothetical protein